MSSEIIRCACGSRSFKMRIPARGHWLYHLRAQEGGGLEIVESENYVTNGRRPRSVECADCGASVALLKIDTISGPEKTFISKHGAGRV